jgi:hypothetical protein
MICILRECYPLGDPYRHGLWLPHDFRLLMIGLSLACMQATVWLSCSRCFYLHSGTTGNWRAR